MKRNGFLICLSALLITACIVAAIGAWHVLADEAEESDVHFLSSLDAAITAGTYSDASLAVPEDSEIFDQRLLDAMRTADEGELIPVSIILSNDFCKAQRYRYESIEGYIPGVEIRKQAFQEAGIDLEANQDVILETFGSWESFWEDFYIYALNCFDVTAEQISAFRTAETEIGRVNHQVEHIAVCQGVDELGVPEGLNQTFSELLSSRETVIDSCSITTWLTAEEILAVEQMDIADAFYYNERAHEFYERWQKIITYDIFYPTCYEDRYKRGEYVPVEEVNRILGF